MKTIRSLVLLTLAIPITALAEEENPFLKQRANKAPTGPAGDSFLTLTEHLLVPSDLLDSWLANHSLAKGASELRAAAQQWIEQGQATIQSSALTPGLVGRSYSNESLIEQIYPTEYEPAPSSQDWPLPTSFEARDIGYRITGDAIREQGELIVRARHGFVKMLPHRAFDRISEETRDPEDVFIPWFRSIATTQAPVAPAASVGSGDSDDPFAPSPGYFPPSPSQGLPAYPVGKTFLALRADEDLPEPIEKTPNGGPPEKDAPETLAPDRPVRLVFIRSDKTDSPPPTTRQPPANNYQLSAKLVSVDQRTLSDWLQGRSLATASKELGAALEQWNEDDKVTVISTLTKRVTDGNKTTLEDIKESKYPTEYKPGKPEPTPDGKSTRMGLAVGTSTETRNLGTSVETYLFQDAGDPTITVSFDRVLLGCYTAHHRVLREGEWIADATMPRFSTTRWLTSLRLQRGEWMFVGSGSDFAELGKLDPSRVMLAFVKVD